MSLFLTRTWEHALLAKVVKEAAEVAEKEGGYLGRTALQKIVYFMQVLKVPMRYRFEVCHYGPFCNTILGDVEWLTADEVIVDRSPRSDKYSKFTPGRSCDELLAKHVDRLQEHEKVVKSTIKALLPLKPQHLELIATLDYAFREVRASLGKKPPRKKVIARFRDFKGDKYQAEEIETTFEQLESAGLFA